MRNILFVGEVLASVTHEMQNVMAIIKESGALADDILNINGRPRMKHGDRLDSALVNIQEQVGRGRDLMLMLNGFAHAAADHPAHSDLPRFARQICVLADRMARLKECRLEPVLDVPPLFVRGNALMIMQSIYRALAVVLETCAPGCTVRVSAGREALAAVLRIAVENGTLREGTGAPDDREIGAIMAEMGGGCRAESGVLELRFAPAPGESA